LIITLASCSGKTRREPPVPVSYEQAYQSFVQGNLVVARQQAHAVYVRLAGVDVPHAWQALLLEANVLFWQGEYKTSLSLLVPELPPELAGDEMAVLRHILRGISQARLGQSLLAESEIREAEKLCNISQCRFDGEIARAQGVLVMARGNDLDQAEKFYRKSFTIARRRSDRFLEATALVNLGWVDLHRERYDSSIDWANASLQASQPINARQLIEVVSGNLGWAYYKMGDFARSLEQYQEAERQAQDLGLDADRTAWMGNIGRVHFETGQYSLAEHYYQQALQLAQTNGDQIQTIQGFTALALLCVQQQRMEPAKQYAQQAYELARSGDNHLEEQYALLVNAEISALSNDDAYAEKTFREVAMNKVDDSWLRWQSRNDLAKLYEKQGRIGEADRQYQEARDAVKAARQQIRNEEFKLPFLTNAVHLYDDYIHFLVEHGKIEEALKEADQSRAQTLAEGLNSRETSTAIPDPQEIARRAGGPILFYWLGANQSYLWVITGKQTVLLKLPAAAEIDSAVKHYGNALLAGPDVLQTENQFGIRLYETLIGPAQKYLPANSHVNIVADRSLNGLNFETLIVAKPELHYWIDDVTVRSASSLRLLAGSTRKTIGRPGKLLLIGDPVVPDPKYPPLSQAGAEMQIIEKYFPTGQSRVYTRAEATPLSYLNSKPDQFSYIHFVAHGTASQTSPLDSAIVLSKASTEEDSFKLHARNIISRPLHADLVTISTCFGSGSKTYMGEGLVGLSWAFLRAGSHNVIGALWEVNDTSTPGLMDKLYAELQKGRSPQDALRNAKLSLLHAPGPYHKPFYWAPFQLYTGS